MRSEKIKLVRGDTAPHLQLTLTDDSDAPINLVGATVTMFMYAAGTEEVLVTREAEVTPENAPVGVAFLRWREGDLLLEPGDYEGEIEVTWGDGLRQTVYDALRFKVRGDMA